MEVDKQNIEVSIAPESFTPDEMRVLSVFFTNTDRSVFFAKNTIPAEVVAALSSRYSRSEKSVRRIFLDEFYNNEEFSSVIGDTNVSENSLNDSLQTKKAQQFFEKWLSLYGDDSIAEMGGVNVFCEDISNIASNYLESFELGSFLEKSSRYVSFSAKDNKGRYGYIVPEEIRGSEYGNEFENIVSEMFELYSELQGPYLDYIKRLYPKEEGETDRSFHNSRSAKRFDDLRDLLPFATKTNVAIHLNGRLLEDIISKGIDHPLSEVRQLCNDLLTESGEIVGSFTKRVTSPRGNEASHYYGQIYRFSLDNSIPIIGKDAVVSSSEDTSARVVVSDVELVAYTDDELLVLASILYDRSDSDLSFTDYRNYLAGLSYDDIGVLYEKVFKLRYDSGSEREKVKSKKLPNAFKLGSYTFEVVSRGGDYRDLFRHRVVVHQRPKFSTKLGYSVDDDLTFSPYMERIADLFSRVDKFYRSLPKEVLPYSEYLIPYAFHQRYLMSMSAWEAYHLIELRTGPQGRKHYREIAQKMSDILKELHPRIFSGLQTDYHSYALSRRNSELRIENKQSKIDP